MKQHFTLVALLALAIALPGLAAAKDNPWIHIEVIEKGSDEAKINVNLPLSMMEVALDIAEDEIMAEGHLTFDDSDITLEEMRSIWRELRNAGDAEFVTVEEDDETVRIHRKGDFVFVEVDDRGGDTEKVNIKVPVKVVDALFAGDGDELNIRGALAELQKMTDGEILSVQDGDDHIRIWID